MFAFGSSLVQRFDPEEGTLNALAGWGADRLMRFDAVNSYDRVAYSRLDWLNLSEEDSRPEGFDFLGDDRFVLIQRAEGLARFTDFELRWFSRESGEMLRELPVTLTDEQYDYLVRYVPTDEDEPSYEEPRIHFAGLTCNPWSEWQNLELD